MNRVSIFMFSLLLSSMTISAQPLRMICLGDSYTIGEAVQESERFPNQTIDLLKDRGYNFTKPLIIATTAWTTDDLQKAIDEANIRDTFDVVTLLIGVNNQYRGRDLNNYKEEFTKLLLQAIYFSNNNRDRVFVLSIPDWGATPFGADRDRVQVSKEIDMFNEANKNISKQFEVNYIDITHVSRNAQTQNDLVASDGLHPSGKMYGIWAAMLTPIIAQSLEH